MKFLIAGLGNIGDEYAHTRHNIGFDIVDNLVAKYKGNWRVDRLASIAEIKIKGKTIICIKPSTYMNLSGKAVKYWLEKEKIPIEHLLVIMDELAIPIEKIRLRPSGSDGGHNGLTSIHESLSTTKYARLRFGIGNQFPKGMQVDYVLGKWYPEQLAIINKKIEASIEIIEDWVQIGLERTMNKANKIEISL
jgi:PTH1 family peptidyl-tRNA hydrolase